MKLLALPILGVLMTVMFSGCTGEPERHVVDFSNVDASQSGGTFHLKVFVLGLQNDTKPIPGAFVGVASGTQAVAKTVANGLGMASFTLRRDQTVTVVAKAPGWTTEDSGLIGIDHRPSSGSAYSFGGAMGCHVEPGSAGCSGPGGGCQASPGSAGCSGPGGSGCGASSSGSAGCTDGAGNGCYAAPGYAGCVVTAGNDDNSYVVTGDEGAVAIILFPLHVRQVIQGTLDPNVATKGIGPMASNGGQDWHPVHQALAADSDLNDLMMLRFQNATTTLSWTNQLIQQADLELGAGCHSGQPPEAKSSNAVPYLAEQQMKIQIHLDFTPKTASMWSNCSNAYYAGPIIDSLTTGVPFTVTNELTFHGRSSIIPVGQ